MTELLAKKNKLNGIETIVLKEKCSAIVTNLPPKLKDPGSFTNPCNVEDFYVGRALTDLGASINLTPLSIVKQLRLNGMKYIVVDKDIPIIQGRPFLATSKMIIDDIQCSDIKVLDDRKRWAHHSKKNEVFVEPTMEDVKRFSIDATMKNKNVGRVASIWWQV
ncbi:uncharacterized protein LOC120171921 [Hibiscus syriacus]|uniref:uncharacterized protein LOC120171921 n=1 Tax=Hibiscus syriacus TaxID=106335 RepID=UPI0019221BD6|nr:uncharacterized protein LOC120171921 [Hibiscus syriacus]